jgi:NADPH:quinone reductase
MPRVADGMRRAVAWYEAGKLKPCITETVPFDAAALQRTFEAFRAGTNNVGKIVVRRGP